MDTFFSALSLPGSWRRPRPPMAPISLAFLAPLSCVSEVARFGDGRSCLGAASERSPSIPFPSLPVPSRPFPSLPFPLFPFTFLPFHFSLFTFSLFPFPFPLFPFSFPLFPFPFPLFPLPSSLVPSSLLFPLPSCSLFPLPLVPSFVAVRARAEAEARGASLVTKKISFKYIIGPAAHWRGRRLALPLWQASTKIWWVESTLVRFSSHFTLNIRLLACFFPCFLPSLFACLLTSFLPLLPNVFFADCAACGARLMRLQDHVPRKRIETELSAK